MNCTFRLAAVVTLVILGCDAAKTESNVPIQTAKAVPNKVSPDSTSPHQTILKATEKTIGGVKFEIPAGWEEKTLSNTMILGEYSLPGTAGPGRLTFSTAGGGTAANMERWKGQFQRGPDDPESKESSITVAGKEVTMIEAYGSFTDTFGGGGSKSNWQLLGVAIPIDSQHNYFVKLTGPRETLAARRDEFIKLVQSAKLE